MQKGLCLVNTMHVTASVFIIDNESGLHQNYKKWLEELTLHETINQYEHNKTCADNAYLKRQIMERESIVVITTGELNFGQ